MSRQGSIGNIIAALASFLLPGLGQLLQGRVFTALFFFVTYGVLGLILFTSGYLWISIPLLFILFWATANAGSWEPFIETPWTKEEWKTWKNLSDEQKRNEDDW